MSFNCKFLSAAVTLALLAPACRREQPASPSIRSLAVMPFEDLSSSASHAWLARLVSFAVVRQLEGAARLQAAEVRAATDLRPATHLLGGFVTADDGTLRLHLFLYELPAHRLVRQRTLSHPAAAWQQLLADAARFLASGLRSSGPVQPLAVHKESAARRLADALNATSPEQAGQAFRAAAEDDPSCGWCWLGWAETALRRNDRQQALSAIENSTPHRDSIDSLSRSRLDLIAANLRSDPLAAVSSLEAIASAAPGDVSAQARLAESLVASRQFEKATAALQRAISMDPSAGVLWNSLAYAQAYAGRFEEALKAVARYSQLDSSPNPADSRGEILMMAGRFTEAYQAFDESYRKDPGFNGGAALEKAALCWMMYGDPRRASETIGRFLDDRAKLGDLSAELHRARWEWITGQSVQAKERLYRIARDSSKPLAPIASSMLALRLSASDPSAAVPVLRSLPPPRDPMHQLYSLYGAAGGNPALLGQIRDARLRDELTALSLTLRRDWTRAADSWKTVIDRSPGGTDSPFRELRAFCLVQAGNTDQAAAVVGASWPLLTQGQMTFYDFLVYPGLFFTRAEIARAAGRIDEARRFYDLFLQFSGDRADLARQAARARAAARL